MQVKGDCHFESDSHLFCGGRIAPGEVFTEKLKLVSETPHLVTPNF